MVIGARPWGGHGGVLGLQVLDTSGHVGVKCLGTHGIHAEVWDGLVRVVWNNCIFGPSRVRVLP